MLPDSLRFVIIVFENQWLTLLLCGKLNNSTQVVRISFADELVSESATSDPQIVVEMTEYPESAELDLRYKEVSYSVYCGSRKLMVTHTVF